MEDNQHGWFAWLIQPPPKTPENLERLAAAQAAYARHYVPFARYVKHTPQPLPFYAGPYPLIGVAARMLRLFFFLTQGTPLTGPYSDEDCRRVMEHGIGSWLRRQ